jgi:putative acetyltransferase
VTNWRAFLRPLVAADVAAAIDLFRASVRGVAQRDYSPDQIAAWAPDEIDRARWSARIVGRDAFVVEMDRRLLGFCELEADGHLDMMFVHPDWQRRGIATALLEYAERAARQRELVRLFTEASLTARPFFERRGFQSIARQTVFLRGQSLVNYRMAKDLT